MCNEDHLRYYKFIGRIAGMAVYHGKLLDGKLFTSFNMHKPLQNISPYFNISFKNLLKIIENLEIVSFKINTSLKQMLEKSRDEKDQIRQNNFVLCPFIENLSKEKYSADTLPCMNQIFSQNYF